MNNFFVNVGKNLADKIQAVTNKPFVFHGNLPRVKHYFFFSLASPDKIATIIRALKTKKSNIENNIESKLVKCSTVIISTVICNLFNPCIEQGKFPDSLKIVEDVPIFKKGDSNQASRHRPISLLSQFSKVLEKLICYRFHHYLEKYNLLSKHQYDFRRNSFSTHTLRNIYGKLLKNADDSLYTCCVFLDLTKAFDTVDYRILLDKLERNYGVRGLALLMMESYLSNRQQHTKIPPCKSKLGKITCGVPQGSSLGPLLFLLYINGQPLVSQFDTTLFADDTYLTLSDRVCLV